MKNYDECVSGILDKTAKKKLAQKRKNRIILQSGSVCVCCLILVLSITVMPSVMNKIGVTQTPVSPVDEVSVPDNSEMNKISDTQTPVSPVDEVSVPDNTDTYQNPSTALSPDSSSINTDENALEKRVSELKNNDNLGWLLIDGKLYVQVNELNGNPERYIGKAGDYEGYYRQAMEKYNIDGDVYTVQNMTDVVCVQLSNGGIVFLRNEK